MWSFPVNAGRSMSSRTVRSRSRSSRAMGRCSIKPNSTIFLIGLPTEYTAMNVPHQLRSISPEGRYRLRVRFTDGHAGVVDVSDLTGQGVFAAWDREGVFEHVTVGEAGEALWDCGVDLCADSLYLR
ncbi:MAG: DUF2442 domain-containing protein [Phycisphaera sp.]|nr:DUF2442 domain-containing protein [Phycisphaera sp.]